MITLSWGALLFILYIAVVVGIVVGWFVIGLAISAGLQDEDKQRENPDRKYF